MFSCQISTHRAEFGKNAKEKDENVTGLMNECAVMKKQVNPNYSRLLVGK